MRLPPAFVGIVVSVILVMFRILGGKKSEEWLVVFLEVPFKFYSRRTYQKTVSYILHIYILGGKQVHFPIPWNLALQVSLFPNDPNLRVSYRIRSTVVGRRPACIKRIQRMRQSG